MLTALDEEIVEQYGRVKLRYSPKTHSTNLKIAKYIINRSMYNVGISRYLKRIIDSKKNLANVLEMEEPKLPKICGIGYVMYKHIKDYFKEIHKKDVKIPTGIVSSFPTLEKTAASVSGASYRNKIKV